MRIYDEENMSLDDDVDEMAGYTVLEGHSIFRLKTPQPEPETVASPIPQNEQTVILDRPDVARLKDGQELTLAFGQTCAVLYNGKTVGGLKDAYVKKLCAERGGQCAKVYYKHTVPPMVRIVFGAGQTIPPALPQEQ